MAKAIWNHNIRFNTCNEKAKKAWDRLHSEEVKSDFKSKNSFVIEAINDYYERHLLKKDDPYFENREKEDAFADRIAKLVEEKTFDNLPAMLGIYLAHTQQISFPVGANSFWQGNMGANPAYHGWINCGTQFTGQGGMVSAKQEIEQGMAASCDEADCGHAVMDEPPDNDLIDFDAF